MDAARTTVTFWNVSSFFLPRHFSIWRRFRNTTAATAAAATISTATIGPKMNSQDISDPPSPESEETAAVFVSRGAPSSSCEVAEELTYYITYTFFNDQVVIEDSVQQRGTATRYKNAVTKGETPGL